MTDKYSVLIKYKYLDYIDNARLSDADTGKFLRGIIEYDKTAEVQEFENPVLAALFAIVKSDIDENRKKWEGAISRNQENGKKGGRPKKNPENPCEPKKPSGFSETQKTHENPKNPQKPKKPDYGGDHDHDYDHGGGGDPQREEISPRKESPPPPPLTFEHIKKQAASTGFVLDDQDARKLLACTDPAWFGDHSFISFVAQRVREKYGGKSAEERRRIFRTVVFTAENFREEYPLWRGEREEQYQKEAAMQEKERVKRDAPTKCQCGAELGEGHRCPQCEGVYWFDEYEWKWVFHNPKDTPNLAEMFKKLVQEKNAKEASG